MTGIPQGYQPIVTDQENIGWSHLWTARWSTRWADYQSEYDRNQEVQRSHRTKWIQEITSIIWEHMHTKWRTRARVVNGHAGTPGRQGLQERVRALYEKKERLPLRYHFLFRLEEQQRLSQDSKPLQAWLHLTEQVITRAYAKAIRASKTQTVLEKWMGSTRRIKRRRRRKAGRIAAWEARKHHQRKQTRRL